MEQFPTDINVGVYEQNPITGCCPGRPVLAVGDYESDFQRYPRIHFDLIESDVIC